MKRTICMLCVVLLLAATFTGCRTITPPDEDGMTIGELKKRDGAGFITEDNRFECEYRGGTLVIEEYRGTETDVVIPAEIDGDPVTAIGSSAFRDSDVVSVTFPDSITQIEDSAFENCASLTGVVLPPKLEFLGAFAFSKCTSLTRISIPGSLKTIEACAFSDSGIEEVVFEEGFEITSFNSMFCGSRIRQITLPATVKTLCNGAFSSCEELEIVILNDGLETIENFAFSDATKLKEIVIPASVTKLTGRAFSDCTGLEAVKFEGDAPEDYGPKNDIEIGDVHYTIYYHESAKGFIRPWWKGYSTALW